VTLGPKRSQLGHSLHLVNSLQTDTEVSWLG